MLRTLALVLLLANALLLAALSGVFDAAGGGAAADREPERLQRQHQPGLVRILSPQAASAALAAASSASAQAAEAASSAQATACLEAGPFSPADASATERTLRDAGLAPASWQLQRQDDGGAFMVYMGRYADREMLQRKLAELKRLKLDGEDLRGAPELQPGISLGRFDNQEAANAAMAQMAKNGLRTARVITLRQAQSQTMLRLPAADATLRARLAGLQLPSGPGFLPCVAGVPAAAGAASASASASASAAGTANAAAAMPVTQPAAASKATPVTAPAPARAASAASAAPTASRPGMAPVAAAPAQAKPTAGPVTTNRPPANQTPASAGPASALASAPASTPQLPVAASVAGAATRAALARAASAAAAEASLSASR